jgi:hypothetical protein
MEVAVPTYILMWLFSVWLMGGYDKPYKLSRLVRGLFIGSLIITFTYAFVNETWRFSRAIIILGAFWTVIASVGLRLLLNLIGLKNYKLDGISTEKNIVIVATQEEGKRVLDTIKQAIGSVNFIGFVHPDKIYHDKTEEFLGNIVQLGEIAEVYRIDEVIFSTKNLPLHEIIQSMAMVKNTHVDYKIAPEESLFIIGSNSVDNPGDLYTIDINFNINKPQHRRNKRILDIGFSVLMLVLLPINLFIQKKPFQFIKNCFDVLLLKKTWVGYINTTIDNKHLPKIRKGILNPSDGLKNTTPLDEHTSKRLNLLYAKHYQLDKDVVLMWRGYRRLGRTYGTVER